MKELFASCKLCQKQSRLDLAFVRANETNASLAKSYIYSAISRRHGRHLVFDRSLDVCRQFSLLVCSTIKYKQRVTSLQRVLYKRLIITKSKIALVRDDNNIDAHIYRQNDSNAHAR